MNRIELINGVVTKTYGKKIRAHAGNARRKPLRDLSGQPGGNSHQRRKLRRKAARIEAQCSSME